MSDDAHTIGAIGARTFGSWTVLSTDSTARRATCQCRCGAIRIVATEALENGVSTSCGCVAMTREHIQALKDEAAARRRQREQNVDWRPEGGS